MTDVDIEPEIEEAGAAKNPLRARKIYIRERLKELRKEAAALKEEFQELKTEG